MRLVKYALELLIIAFLVGWIIAGTKQETIAVLPNSFLWALGQFGLKTNSDRKPDSDQIQIRTEF